ncbi:dihydropteroate synthase [Pseudoroseicyclus aestuarii]|uniref:Dihydropteroate synthase n=1 Tax=Pseudoroseicyclus aestuarii TaxID=1795041 RepID=A0A318SV02_9RHOB|nr:dihydropteroate synthase [Pseudoroseicyclus aestuarii]PYE85741.1 dihydropteroate synthase [Pseudoroseicyclus aestuarii]
MRPRPIAGPEGPGLPLAGSRSLRFSEIWQGGARLPAGALEPGVLARLTEERPALCRLSLDRPRLMGILNVTPDSFSDGGDHLAPEEAVARARAMVAAGADILDIGGESTRPGAAEVPAAEEARRVVPVVAALRAGGIATPISIDTRKAAVARATLAEGADMINDVAALGFDPDLAGVVAEAGVPVCLMHHRGTPETMQAQADYADVTAEVADWLEARIEAATAQGIDRANIVIDPGIGFGKTLQHNVSVLRGLALYHGLGQALLVGASRKRFIGTLGGAEAAKDRMPGSVAVALWAAQQGAQILRVHDVAETRQALSLQQAIMGEQARDEGTRQ